MHALQKQVGKRIRELREIRGLSQEALADVCNLHRTYIGLIERGERNLSVGTVEVIAAGLEVNASEIFATPGAATGPKVPPAKRKAKLNVDVTAHLATIREVLIEAKLTDAKGYATLFKANLKDPQLE